MAVSASKIAGSYSTTGASSYTVDLTGITMSANTLYLLHVNSIDSPGGGDTPSGVSGRSLTWVKVNAASGSLGTLSRGTVFRAMGTPASTGNLTISFGEAQVHCAWTLIEVTGTDTSGTNGSGAIAQIKQAADDGFLTSLTITFDSTPASGNANFGFFNFGNDLTGSGEGGYTQLDQYAINSTADWGGYITYKPESGGDTTVYCSIGGTSAYISGLAIEVKVVAPKPTVSASVDSFVKNTQSANHSIDALLSKNYSVSHSVSALKQKRISVLHSVDSRLWKRIAIQYSVQSYLTAGTKYLITNVSSLIKKRISATHSVQSYVATRTPKTTSLASLLKKRITAFHSVNALIRKTYAVNHSVSSYLAKRGAPYSRVDSLLKKTKLTVVSSVDAFPTNAAVAGNGAHFEWADGFEVRSIANDDIYFDKANVTIDTSIYRSGSASLKVTKAANSAGLGRWGMKYGGLETGHNDWVGTRVYIRFDSLPNMDTLLLSVVTYNVNCGIWFNATDNTLYLKQTWTSPDTTSAIPNVTVTTGVWYYLEVSCYYGMNQTLKTYGFAGEDGGAIYGTFINTGQTIGYQDNPNRIRLASQAADATFTAYYDDWVEYSGVTTPLNMWGTGRVFGLLPASDGTHNISAGNFYGYSNGSESQITNSTTNAYSYIDAVPFDSNYRIEQRSNASNEYVELKFTQITDNYYTIRGASCDVFPAAGGTQANDGNISIFDAANVESQLWITGPMDYPDYSWSTETGVQQNVTTPSGGWNVSAVNALKARFGYSTDAAPDIYLVGIILNVDAEVTPRPTVKHYVDSLLTGGRTRKTYNAQALILKQGMQKIAYVDTKISNTKYLSYELMVFVGNATGTEYPWGTKGGNEDGYGFYFGSFMIPYFLEDPQPDSYWIDGSYGAVTFLKTFMGTHVNDGTYLYTGGFLNSWGPGGIGTWIDNDTDPSDCSGLPQPYAYWARYNPVNDTWESLTPPEDSTGYFIQTWNTACYHDGKIYAFNGEKYYGDKRLPTYRYPLIGDADTFETWIYDIATDTWEQGATVPSGVNNGYYRYEGEAVPFNNKIYLIGGWGSGTNTAKNNRIDCYDIATDSWTTGLGPLEYEGGGCDHSSAFVHNDKIWIFGNHHETYASVVFTYDPATDSVVRKGTLKRAHGEVIGDNREYNPHEVYAYQHPYDSNKAIIIPGYDYSSENYSEVVTIYDMNDDTVTWFVDMPINDPVYTWYSEKEERPRYCPYDYNVFGRLEWWPVCGGIISSGGGKYWVYTRMDGGTMVWNIKSALKAGWGILL